MSLYHVWNEVVLLDLKNMLALRFLKSKRFWDFHKTQILDEEVTDLSHDQIKALGGNSANSFNNKLEKLEEYASEEIVGKLGMRNFEFCNKLGSLAVEELGVYFPAIAAQVCLIEGGRQERKKSRMCFMLLAWKNEQMVSYIPWKRIKNNHSWGNKF